MKKLYFDSSYLFRVYSEEPGHLVVKNLAAQSDLLVSAWHARAEFASIILRHRKEETDTAFNLEELHQQFLDEHRNGYILLLPLTEPVMERLEAVLHTAPVSIFLRAADALHLACAAQHGFTEVYSNDRHFLAAAPLFGLEGINVIGKAE